MRRRKGSLTLMKDGHYRARLFLADGSRPVVHLPPGLTLPQAEAKARALSEASKNSRIAKPGTTIVALVDAWLLLVDKGDGAPATKHAHHGNGRRIVRAFGALNLADLTTGRLRTWIRSMREEGLSPGRIHQVWSSMHRLVDTAMGEEWVSLPASPLRHPGMKGVLPPVEAPAVRVLTDVEVDTILKSPRRLRYLVALTSGLRDGEISALRWCDIREVEGILCFDVQKSVTPIGGPTVKATKTRSSKRLVPVHPALATELRGTGEAPLFPGPDGGFSRPHSAYLLREDLGEPESPLTFHALRRTFSTRLDAAGVPGELADRLLGHAPKSMRERHYNAIDLKRMASAVESAWELPRQLPRTARRDPSEEAHAAEVLDHSSDQAAGQETNLVIDDPDVLRAMSADVLALDVLGDGVRGDAKPAESHRRGNSWQLEEAIRLASIAGKWDVVATLARVLAGAAEDA